MSAKDFFERGAQLMKLHPPNTTDYSEVWRLERLGIVPGEDFEFDALDASTQGMLQDARTSGYAKIVKKVDDQLELKNEFTIAVDSVGAGTGELVLCSTGSSARMTDVTENKPVDAVIMAIVDEVDLPDK